MRALITGVAGFAGSYLTDYLLTQADVQVWGVSLNASENWDALPGRLVARSGDLSDPAVTFQILSEAAPERVFHLAAQSYPAVSWEDPWATLENNIRAEVNLLHAAARLQSRARILVVGSSDEYGHVEPEDLPIDEETPLRPNSPYGVSKIAQDYLGLQYCLSHHLQIVRVRPFNHIGPRQNERFVASDFAKQIAEIEAGLREPRLHVGNLDARRDFTDVRDMVRAYVLALEFGVPGEVYNIGSGQAHSIRELLDHLLSLAAVPVRVESESARSRPSDIAVAVCDATKFKKQTGWEPQYRFERTLQDILEYWRERVSQPTLRET